MAVRSQFNNRLVPLIGLGSFTGQAEKTVLGNALSVALYADTLTTLTIEQSPNSSNWYIFQQQQIQPNVQSVIQMQTTLEYFRVTIHNESETAQVYCNMVTSLVKIMSLNAMRDSISMYATDITTGQQHPINCDGSGNIITVSL